MVGGGGAIFTVKVARRPIAFIEFSLDKFYLLEVDYGCR